MATYSSPEVIRQWANPTVAPFYLWDVRPYIAAAEVVADSVTNIQTEAEMETAFQRLKSTALYDAIIVERRTLNIP